MQNPSLPEIFLRLPIAHRALHDRSKGVIENSITAIKAAIAAGYAIEIDLQLSKDGQAITFHDESLERLTGQTGFIKDRTAAELSAIKLSGSEDFIPTFAEVLALIDGQVPLLVEIKDQTLTMSQTDGRLEAEAARLLHGYSGPVAVMSFNPHSIAHMARLAPDIARGLTTSVYDYDDWAPLSPSICDHLRDIPDYDRSSASFISHEAAGLNHPRVAELQAKGADILCWTIRSPEAEALARKTAANITFEGYLAAK